MNSRSAQGAQLHVFLLLGQSNMAGRGRMDEVPPLRDERVWMFRNDQWQPAEEPLHNDKPDRAGVGLGMSFAMAVVEHGVAPVGLVPCAVGGTRLEQWLPGAERYTHAIRTAREALKSGVLRGILWHQGEADAHALQEASTYGDRLTEMIHAIRADLNAGQVPFLAGELGRFLRDHPGADYFEVVNQQLWTLPDRLENVGVVSAEGLGDNGDTLHFNAGSLREFGRRYAQVFLEMR